VVGRRRRFEAEAAAPHERGGAARQTTRSSGARSCRGLRLPPGIAGDGSAVPTAVQHEPRTWLSGLAYVPVPLLPRRQVRLARRRRRRRGAHRARLARHGRAGESVDWWQLGARHDRRARRAPGDARIRLYERGRGVKCGWGGVRARGRCGGGELRSSLYRPFGVGDRAKWEAAPATHFQSEPSGG
jgi:hypothetical protein